MKNLAQPYRYLDIEKGTASEWNFLAERGGDLYDRLASFQLKLRDMAHIFVGLQTSADTVFLFKQFRNTSQRTLLKVSSKELNREIEIERQLLKPVIRSGKIGRHWAAPTALVLFPYKFIDNKAQLIPEREMARDFPYAWNYLKENKQLLAGREHGKFSGTGWYAVCG